MGKFLVLIAVQVVVLAGPQEDPLRPRSLEYVAKIGGEEIGRETVTITEQGWNAEGWFDVLGTQKGKYQASLERLADGGILYQVASDASGKKVVLEGSLQDGQFKTAVKAAGYEKTTEIDSDRVFIFDSLLWACMIELGRVLVDIDDPEPELEITGLSGNAGVDFPVTLKAFGPLEQTVYGKSVELQTFTVEIPPATEVKLFCTSEGLPLRVDIPSQMITVIPKGYESIRGENPGSQPRWSMPVRGASSFHRPLSNSTCDAGSKSKCETVFNLLPTFICQMSKAKYQRCSRELHTTGFPKGCCGALTLPAAGMRWSSRTYVVVLIAAANGFLLSTKPMMARTPLIGLRSSPGVMARWGWSERAMLGSSNGWRQRAAIPI